MARSLKTGLAALLAALGLAVIASTVSLAAPKRTANPASPVVIELFTSQGCSSCPPADQLMAEFARDPDLLVITRPVTYWDRLGWKDTLARKENTALQWAYAHNFTPGTGIFTPQAVIQGNKAAVGSHKEKILALAKESRGQSPAALVVSASEVEGYGANVSGRADKPAELMLVALDSSERVAIGNGENSGRSITYTNVVRDEHLLGTWRGGRQSFAIPASLLSVAEADRYALLLREAEGGPILAAALLPSTGS